MAQEPQLDQKVALVTGAGVRLGREIALRLGSLGMRVAVHCHRSVQAAEETCRELRALGTAAEVFTADLSVRAEARRLVDAAAAWQGRLDLLVLSAASFERIPFAQLDDDAWDRSLNLNSASQFSLAHQAAPLLTQTQGNMVFITCGSTITPYRNHLPYVVSKAATLQLARTLALELAPHVRVNAVAPGTVLPPEDMSTGMAQRLKRSIPLQRFGSARDIADAVAYLASAPFVTGQQIVVDGGRSVAAIESFG